MKPERAIILGVCVFVAFVAVTARALVGTAVMAVMGLGRVTGWW